MKRLVWFGAGAVSGAVGAAYAYSWLREARDQATADRAAELVARTARRAGATARQAYREGREAVADADEQIRADLEERERRTTKRRHLSAATRPGR